MLKINEHVKVFSIKYRRGLYCVEVFIRVVSHMHVLKLYTGWHFKSVND